MARVFGCMITRPSATASRSVTDFAATSTMRASPRLLRCVSVLARRGTMLPGRRERGLARKQCARRGGDIVLPHQTFADQERRDAGLAEPRQIVRSEYAALADHDAAGRNEPGQPLAGRKCGGEGFQIAIVDADQLRFQGKRPLQLLLI